MIVGILKIIHMLLQQFSKFIVPLAIIKSSIQEFLYIILNNIKNFELIDSSDSYFLFTFDSLIFNVTWKKIDMNYEFAVIVGTHFEIINGTVFVYTNEDDASTVINDHDIANDSWIE